MKFRLLAPTAAGLILGSLLAAAAASSPHTRFIQLRNDVIPTKPLRAAERAPAAPASQAPVTGLFLVQFEGPVQPEWREQLAAMGVALLEPVPTDAFVARCDQARPGLLRTLPFIHWMGPYRPEHKVHRGLADQAKGRAADGPLDVAVLLAPRLPASELAEVRRAFSAIRQESNHRSGPILRGRIPAGRLEALARSEAVLWIEPAPAMKLYDEVASKIVAGDGGPNTLLTMSLGYDGAGVRVAVADSGLHNGEAASMHPDLFGRTPAFFYYGNLTDAADEHSHGTHVAGIVAGNGATGEVDEFGALYGLGVAPGASIIAQRLFDAAGNYEPPSSFDRMTRDAVRVGADIGSNSWGDDTQGRYDLSAREFDLLVRDADWLAEGDQPYILEFSAGNAGPGTQTIGSPAVAKNVIATGAVENDRQDFLIYADGPDAMADFSSRGPCEDGRIKPDVVAPGTWIASLQSASATDQYAWSPISPNYQYQGGTSQAGPHASGAAAVFVQYYRQTHTNLTPSPALVKAALINSAVDCYDEFGTGPVPNNDEGWGRIDLVELLDSTRTYQFLDQSVLLTTGQQYEQRILVDTQDEPLKITLVYTDAAGFPGAIPALVNDLDLEVVGPNGRVYRGNSFANGESVPDTVASDDRNNVEAVHLWTPIPGEYVIRVRARNVVTDARADTPGLDQDFALVVSASIAPPGTGILTFDRLSYRAPDQMRLALVDHNLAGAPNATIALSSTTETTPETLLLQASGPAGNFTGTVATVTGPPAPDGRLQVSHGDVIEARYQDAAPPATRLFTAQADLLPPLISNLHVTNRFGRAEVRWTTDEPASSLVVYGSNLPLSLSLTGVTFATSHAVPLTGLVSGTTNFFYLVCADVAGNRVTNDNNGELFVVVPPRAPAILMVDGFVEDFLIDPPPDLGNYTRCLDQLGLSYDVWKIETEPQPITAADLRPYRVVLWRLPEFSLSRPTFTAGERAALIEYLNGGGGLFVASMEAASRLDDTGAQSFRKEVLHIADFEVDAGVPDAEGVPDDPIGDGLFFSLDYTFDYFGFDFSDTLTPGPNAAGILYKSGTGKYAGIRFPRAGVDSPARVVYLGFPFDAIPADEPPPGDRTTLMRRVLVFLAPGLNGEGSIVFDRGAYTIPSQVTLEIADSDLEGQSQATATFYTETLPAGTPLTLAATTRPGIFRGTVSLSATPSGSPTEFVVRDGETIRATYFDSSLNALVTAQALIETNPPSISLVSATPGYVDALITWETSELADSTVQFGESPLLGRSAASDELTDYHEINLYQLQPDRTYYFRVISRDRAGNVAMDDNGGRLYTFRTLAPLQPPWYDNLEHGSTNWVVYTPEESEIGWQLGQPNPLFGTPANSPVNCWAANLNYAFISQVESYLISPAIVLTGGNQAVLRFAQTYDFTYPFEFDIFHAGEVLLIPNDALAPITLAEYSDDLADWHEVEFDLSPHLGKVVYIAWHYFMLSFDPWPRMGWMVDDISITVSNVQPGTVVITNNLWQAGYSLSGPLSTNAGGRFLALSNAPPGSYTIEYADLAYYQTPAAQTKLLAEGGTVTFNGVYTLADANGNGIPDDWEQRYFGNVSAHRSNTTDTDGDGMSDWAEFVAGTDPNSPPRAFNLLARQTSGNTLRLEWASVPGQQYRVLQTTNFSGWTPYTSWSEATSTVSRLDIPIPTGAAPAFYRVQAGATNSPAGLPPNLRLTVAPSTNNTLRLSWPSAAGRGYRLLSSTNAINWIPATGWFRALATTTSATNLPVPVSPQFYRLEVQP
ncbi:MAG TPA: S8 family serine peptidase [Candidatus Paceibacterota bacterium]|nr:S8 family serine peptidase [Candidatus Paceibacterota bacterium]